MYRDGVSEGQFDAVQQQELPQVDMAVLVMSTAHAVRLCRFS